MNLEELFETTYFNKLKESDEVGVEIEMPLVNLNDNHIVNPNVVQQLFTELQTIDFIPNNYDNNNQIISLKNKKNNDTISLEYSYNTLEFSLNKEINIFKLMDKFKFYYNFINTILENYNYKLFDTGINPYYKEIDRSCLHQKRYKTIEKLLVNENDLYTQFCSYCCSIQTHINVSIDNVVSILNTFAKINKNKQSMFSNSYMEETGLKNSRKYLWEKSNFGPKNIGPNKLFQNIEDLKDDYLNRNLFFIERNHQYYLLKNKHSLKNYFNQKKIEVIDLNGKEKTIKPLKKDFENFRSYKDVELTKYGTLEIRTDCTQKIQNIFKVVAFNVGISLCFKEIENEVDITNEKLIEYAIKGLKQRNYGEEILLEDI